MGHGSGDDAAEQLRQQLGVVLQETFLFDARFGQREVLAANVPKKQVMRRAGFARVDEFATRFSGGYDTIVGERGVKALGRARRQRLSIAPSDFWRTREF